MLILRILSIILIIPGIVLVFGAKKIVSKYELYKKIECSYENEMNESEISQYKLSKAVINIKMLGFLAALPGFVLVIIAFR